LVSVSGESQPKVSNHLKVLTEHQPHLGGALGAAICGRFFEEGWVEKDQKTRAVRLTDAGRSALEGRLGLVADGVGA
jgi:hypothetical protein